MAVTLAPVARGEYDAFFATVREYLREMNTYDPHAADDPFDVDRYEAAVRAEIAAQEASEERELLWILDGRERAGFAIVRTLPDWPDDSRMVASIAEFYVAPAFRRRGVGRAAVEALLAEHRRRGTYEVEAGILRENHPARAFWQRMGFELRSYQTARRP